MADGFDGKVVLITGANGGLGVSLVDAFRRAGAQVVGVDREGADCLHADVGTAAGVELMVSSTLERHGRLDVLVLNAGVQHVAPIADFDEDQWDRLQDVMLKGPFLALRSAWDQLVANGGNAVVISSTSAFAAEPLKAAYVAAKTGVLGLVRNAALEGGPHGVRVNAVAPGWMLTPMAEKTVEALIADSGMERTAAIESMLDRQPVKRFVETDEVAAAVLFLASPAASAITGCCLPVDLGLLAG